MKKAAASKRGRGLFVRVALLLAIAGGALFFLHQKKEKLLRDCLRFLETSLHQQTDLRVQVERIDGNVFGRLRLQNLRVREPGDEGRTLFSAKEIRVRYRFLDFLSKRPDKRLAIELDHPELYWAPRVTLRKPQLPFLGWMRQWALSNREHVSVRTDDLDFFYGETKKKIRGVRFHYEDNTMRAVIPLSHVDVMGLDVSSEIEIQGGFSLSADPARDAVRGTVATQGTVVDWKPVDRESRLDFVLSRDGLEFPWSDLFGGIEVTGRVAVPDLDMDMRVRAEDYPFSNLAESLGFGQRVPLPGRADLDVAFRGDVWAPSVEGRATVRDGWIGRRTFRSMELHFRGVHPTVKLENSGISLSDGTIMRFADTTLELGELFHMKTYEALVSEAQQERVVWGDWSLTRAEGRGDNREDFLMERALTDRASLQFRRYNDEREPAETDPTGEKDAETRQMGVGFEYRLRSKDSLKFEMREGEEFVGVERKMKF